MSEDDARPVKAKRTSLARLIRDQRVAYLAVGAVNVVVGFGIFVVCSATVGHFVDERFGKVAGSLVTLVIMYVLSVSLAFVLHRRFVFRVRGHVVRDFVRYWGVYLTTLGFNAVMLPLLVELGMPRVSAQAIIVAATPLLSYFGHRYFTFRRSDVPALERDAARAAGTASPPADEDAPRQRKHVRRN